MGIEYLDSSERFGMAGPWIGKLKINKVELKHEFLENNFASSKMDFFMHSIVTLIR